MLNKLRSLLVWEKPFARRFFNLAVPIAVQSLVASSMHLVDNVMIGGLGEMEMAAVTQANRFSFIFNLTLFGMTSGSAAFAAQAWGKRDIPRIRQTMGMSMCFSAMLLALFATFALGYPHVVSAALLSGQAARDMAAEYLRIVGVGYIFFAVSEVFAVFQKSTERTRIPMAASIVAIVTNTILNYLLIYGKFGFPRLGVRGAAIATVVGLALECALNIIGGYITHSVTAVRPRDLIPESWAFVKQYARVVATVTLNEGLWALGVAIYSIVYGRMGESAVAAVSIAATFEQFSFIMIRAVTSACAVLVGAHVGAGERKEAHSTALRMMAATVTASIVSGMLMIGMSRLMIQLFNASAGTIADALRLITISACVMPVHAMTGMLIVGILRAGGDTVYSLVIDAGSAWFFGAPLVAIAGLLLRWPVPVVYLCAQSESIVKFSLGMYRFRSGRWIHDLTKSEG